MYNYCTFKVDVNRVQGVLLLRILKNTMCHPSKSMGNVSRLLSSGRRFFWSLSKAALCRLGAVAAVIAISVQAAQAAAVHVPLSGSLWAHDPSTMITDGSQYYYYCTGQNIVSRSSSNTTYWQAGSSVFSTTPTWTTTAVPGFTGYFWAPEISYFNNLYHLYYAVSTFGSQVSAIGMATSTSLSSPLWSDHGSAVLQSQVGSAFNAIDPAIFTNTDGKMWMTFGSFWQGIYEVQLDPASGLLLSPSNPVYTQLAKNPADPNDAIEASYLYHRGGYYYLFVNWGNLNNTYNIRVGRSTSVNGPFLDQSSVNMVSGGGTLFLGTEGNYVAPGQIGIYTKSNTEYYSYHYLDGQNNNSATYGISQMFWTNDAWPSSSLTDSIWCGASAANNLWSSGVNWGGNAPATGTDLKFGATVSGGFTTSQNDNYAAPQYTALRFLSNSAAYTLVGTAIRLTGPIVNSSANNQVVNLNVVFDTGAGSIDTGAKKLTIGGILGEVGGSKSLTKTGTGELVLKAINTYTGSTNINQGVLTIDGGDLADASTINVAAGATLQVTSGTPGLGDVSGLGSTSVSGAGTVLTVNSITQNTLTIGSGATVIINYIPGGPLGGNSVQAVPEPGTLLMLLIAAMAAIIVKKKSTP
jgi:arabinan endo-1,5-alpha-L-arabinosidase